MYNQRNGHQLLLLPPLSTVEQSCVLCSRDVCFLHAHYGTCHDGRAHNSQCCCHVSSSNVTCNPHVLSTQLPNVACNSWSHCMVLPHVHVHRVVPCSSSGRTTVWLTSGGGLPSCWQGPSGRVHAMHPWSADCPPSTCRSLTYRKRPCYFNL